MTRRDDRDSPRMGRDGERTGGEYGVNTLDTPGPLCYQKLTACLHAFEGRTIVVVVFVCIA